MAAGGRVRGQTLRAAVAFGDNQRNAFPGGAIEVAASSAPYRLRKPARVFGERASTRRKLGMAPSCACAASSNAFVSPVAVFGSTTWMRYMVALLSRR
jgi:hypothetical protein